MEEFVCFRTMLLCEQVINAFALGANENVGNCFRDDIVLKDQIYRTESITGHKFQSSISCRNLIEDLRHFEC